MRLLWRGVGYATVSILTACVVVVYLGILMPLFKALDLLKEAATGKRVLDGPMRELENRGAVVGVGLDLLIALPFLYQMMPTWLGAIWFAVGAMMFAKMFARPKRVVEE